MTKPLPIAIMLSGSGTTLQNLIDHIAMKSLNAQIVQVISSKPNVKGIERAKSAGLAFELVERKSYSDLNSFSRANFELCRKSNAKMICLAGYLQLLSIPDDFEQKVINIHPSLLPAFGGKGMYGHHVHEAVLNYGAKYSGCTVHFADNQFDHGAVILQKTVPVLDEDTPDSLAKRVFEAECEAYPEVIQAFADNRVVVRDRKVSILKPT